MQCVLITVNYRTVTLSEDKCLFLLAHILDICALKISSCPLFSLSQPHHVTASHPSPGDNHQNTGGPFERTLGQSKTAPWNSLNYICTKALHSFWYFAHCRSASTVIPLLPKATFASSIHPNLGFPRTRPPLTSAINTRLAIRYSFILSTFPYHLNTLLSALLGDSRSIPASYAPLYS